MPEADPAPGSERILMDAGVFIGALLKGDPRHAEALPLVEAARQGIVPACTITGILSEVYGAWTWEKAEPRHDPRRAAEAVRLLVEPPSALVILAAGLEVGLRMLELAARHRLTGRRIHDARHAAAALVAGVTAVHTYDANDWDDFAPDGLRIVGLPSTLARLAQASR